MMFCKSLNLFTDVVNYVKPGRLLGLKVGTKYIGVAVSDTNYELVSPYCVVEKKDNNIGQIASELKSVAMDVNKFMYDLNNTKLLKGVKCGDLLKPFVDPNLIDLFSLLKLSHFR
nr:ribonuclease H-like superfamily protein isoform X1 [Tanacetum cinerariifolium]